VIKKLRTMTYVMKLDIWVKNIFKPCEKITFCTKRCKKKY